MTTKKSESTTLIKVLSIIAILFGLMTIKSGGEVLFIDGVGRANAGNYVPFVLWFNFIAGFVYVLTGAGLLLKKTCAAWMSIFLASSTLIVFALLGLHILNDGAFETRTIGAMSLRSLIWVSIALVAYLKLIKSTKDS